MLYASADSHLARAVVEAFEAESGLRVGLVTDTEATKTTGLAQRIRAERARPQADVFWSSEVFWTIRLAEEDLLAPYHGETTSDWPARYRDAGHRWHGFAARARVIVYAPDRVEPPPRTWMDLTREEYRGRIVMADPRFGTTGGHLGAMKAFWDGRVMPGYYAAFLEGLADNEVRLHPGGNAGVVQAVADGEADVGLTDTDDVWAAKTRGLGVHLVYPRHIADTDKPGGGTLLIPNSVALVAGAQHPEAAAVLIEFLLSETVERMLAESDSHNIPLRPSLAGAYPDHAVPDPLAVDYARAASRMPDAIDEAMRHLSGSP
ncbi:MAG: ABC transporter substrate-binding protein [Planctomycetota bacterium]